MKKLLFFLFIISSYFFQLSDVSGQVSLLWKNPIKTSLNSVNQSIAMELDKFGNCYILGITWVADSTKDVLLMKFDPKGQEIWRRFFDGPAHLDDIPVAMCLDQYSDVIITGTSKNKKGNTDIFVTKFSNEGVPVFSKQNDGKDGLYDAPTSIVCDLLGNIFVGGYVTTQDSGLNTALFKFYPEGSLAWFKSSGSINMDVVNALVTDDSCNVYLGGNYNVGLRTSDMLIQKFDSTGLKRWEYIYDGLLAMSDGIFHLATDDSTNLYVSGYLNHGSDRSDIPVFKLTRNGEMLQENLYFGGMTDCMSKQMYVDKSGAYITASQSDYMRGINSTIAVYYNKAGEQKISIKNDKGIRFGKIIPLVGDIYILGTGLIRPENTLIPFVAEVDTGGGFRWEYADSTVAGLSHMVDYKLRGSKLYFLGDDTGEATGTITLFCYQLKKSTAKKPKSTTTKPSQGAIRKN